MLLVLVPIAAIALAVVLGRRALAREGALAGPRASGFGYEAGVSGGTSGELFAASPAREPEVPLGIRIVHMAGLVALILACAAVIAALLWGLGHLLNQEMARYVNRG